MFGLELVVEVVVDLDGGRPAAGADALHFFERKEAVGGDAIGTDAELFAEALVDVVGSAQHATDVGADLDVEFAGRLEAEHGVVGGDVAHFELGDADAAGDLGDDRVGEIADFILRVEQHGDEGRALDRIFLDQRVKARGQLGREHRHGVRIRVFEDSSRQLRRGLLHQLPRPGFGGQIHFFLAIFAAHAAVLGEFRSSAASIFSRPGYDCVVALRRSHFAP